MKDVFDVFDVLINIVIIIGVLITSVSLTNKVIVGNIKERAVQTDMAEYNSTTGEFQYLDKDLEFIIKGK